jgi:hypothetical protein
LSIKFNPFTSNFDFVGAGADSPYFKPPVADRASLPSGDADGTIRVVLDEESIFQYDQASDEWHNTRLSLSQFNALANAAGVTIDVVTTSGVNDYRINLHKADETNPGGVSIDAQTFGGDKTFADDVIITGDLTVNGTTTTINTQTLDVEDANVTINKNGNDISAEGSGLTIERAGTDGSLIYEDALASKFKAGSVGSEIELVNVSSSQTITNKNLKSNTNLLTGAKADSVERETGNESLITIPDASSADNFVLESHAQTISNKTIDNTNSATLLDTNLTLQDNVDNTKQANFELSGITTSTTRTFGLPDDDTTLVGDDTTQILTNKTIDGTSATGTNTVTIDAADATYDNSTSGLTATNAQTAIDEVEGRLDTAESDIADNTSDIADIRTTTGTSDGDTNMGTYTGSLLNDNESTKQNIQQLETATEARVVGPGSSTDNAVARYDSTTGKLIQDSVVTIDDLGEASGLTALNVDNIRIDSNTISSTNTDGDVILAPDGTGDINASTSVIKNVVDPTNDQDAATKKYVDDNTTFVPGDLDEVSFSLSNNQAAFTDVTGVAFANGVTRSAELEYSVVIDATADLYESGKIIAIQKGADWEVSQSVTGDNSQIILDINSSGQLQYKSANYAGFVSGTIKVRATTTSV